MPDDNYAILVGISRYRGDADYPPLDGPLHDVEHIQEWLADPLGGNVDRKNISVLTTPSELVTLKAGANPDTLDWSPDQAAFIRAFQAITLHEGHYRRRDSRLYLYFSGHGFSQSADTSARAALFAANAFGIARPNIPGTVYAEAAKRVGLFREIVLIMDCCRDVQRNSPYGAYELDQTESGISEKVRLFAMYASAKNGKAQEREFAAHGKVYGLLTHALVKALDEAPTNVLGQVSSTTLNNYLKVNWKKWCPLGIPAPEPPRTVPADAGDIFFNTRRKLATQQFTVDSPSVAALRLQSDVIDAVGTFEGDQIYWRERNDLETVMIALEDVGNRKQFSLRLPEFEHSLTVAGLHGYTTTFVPGAQNVIEL